MTNKKPKPEVLKVLDDWARKDSREWANWEEFELDSEEAPLIKDMAKYAYEQGKLDLVELLEKKGYYAIVKKLLKKGKTDSTTTATETMSELSVWLKSQLIKERKEPVITQHKGAKLEGEKDV